MKEKRNPESVHAPLAAYSHQIEIRGPQRWLVLSGQVGIAADGAPAGGAGDQLDVALENIVANLRAADMTPHDLVKMTIYLVDPIDPETRAAALSRHLGDVAPCMTLAFVPRLASPALKVEIDAWAAADAS
jgi:2-iminobutanoate/2-iminopropanoate deaminase